MAVQDDCIESCGLRYALPAGTHIAWSIFQLQHRRDLWQDDADQFKPSRWLEGSTGHASSAFQAWGCGPRIVRADTTRRSSVMANTRFQKCIGQELGTTHRCYTSKSFRLTIGIYFSILGGNIRTYAPVPALWRCHASNGCAAQRFLAEREDRWADHA